MKSRSENYNEHAKFMAEIALAILNNDAKVLYVSGVKEIIALYLLIPYITPGKLETPGVEYKIPNITGNFSDDIKLTDLRNSICHSFVTVEENRNDETIHGKRLILDDRVLYSRCKHDKLEKKSFAANIDIEYAHDKLRELFKEVMGDEIE